MRVLLDQGVPAPLRKALSAHAVETAYERGWSRLKNGELIASAEAEGFDVFVTTDRNLKFQQNFAGRRLAVVVLTTTSWPRIQRSLDDVVRAIDGARVPSYAEVSID